MKPTDGERRPVSERVVAAVGRELDEDPTDLDPLYHAVDPEALNDLFPSEPAADDSRARRFTFTYEEFVVDVAHDGTVELSPVAACGPADEPADPVIQAVASSPDSPD